MLVGYALFQQLKMWITLGSFLKVIHIRMVGGRRGILLFALSTSFSTIPRGPPPPISFPNGMNKKSHGTD